MKKPDKLEVGQIWGYFSYTVIKILNKDKILMKSLDGNHCVEYAIKEVINWDFKGYNAKIMLREKLKREKNNAQQ